MSKSDVGKVCKAIPKRVNRISLLSDISRNADCSRLYTPHCLRATAIQEMHAVGYEIRHIMHMSGHKSEGSVRSYNRDCSSTKKKGNERFTAIN